MVRCLRCGRGLSGVRGGLLLYAADHHHCAVRLAARAYVRRPPVERTLAGSIGTSITTTMWTDRESMHHSYLSESVNPFNPNSQKWRCKAWGMTQQASAYIAQQITNQGLIISANGSSGHRRGVSGPAGSGVVLPVRRLQAVAAVARTE